MEHLTDPRVDGVIGLLTLMLNLLCYIFHEFYPVITITGAIAGSFVAIVSAIRIIRGWYRGTKHEIDYHHHIEH